MITKISGDGYCRCGRNITVPYVYMDHNLHLACKINNYSLQPSKIIKVVCNVTKKKLFYSDLKSYCFHLVPK